MANAKDQIATPGTHIPGPLHVEAMDPAQTAFTDLPASVDDQTAGTPDTTDYTLATVGDTSTVNEGATINNNFATLAALVDSILERIQ